MQSKPLKWASLHDLTTSVPTEVVEEANKQAWRYVWDAANWELEQSSSTSGMYGSWFIKISPNTTVKDLTKFHSLPTGVGGDIIDALKDFTEKMKVWNDKNGF